MNNNTNRQINCNCNNNASDGSIIRDFLINQSNPNRPRYVLGPIGPTGPTGPTGPIGADAPVPTLTIGTVTTGAPGTEAAATITGEAPDFVLNLTIPQGPTGPAA